VKITAFLRLTIAVYLLFSAALFSQEVRVDKIKFKDNKTVSSRKLSQTILTHGKPWSSVILFWKSGPQFDEDVLLQDLMRVERFYQREGYLQAHVKDYQLQYNRKRDRVKITIFVEEGKPMQVESVEVAMSDSVDPSRGIDIKKLPGILILKEGKRYREEDLTLDHAKLVERFSNRGYPYIDAKVKPILDEARHRVRLEWRLNPGPLCYFGDIAIIGNESVANDVILRGLGFRTGRPFVQSRLTDAQSQVYRLELFQFVSLRAMNLDQRSQNIPIEVRVREAVPRTLKLGVGYGSEESIRASAQWRHRNFLGGARILRMLAKHSTKILPVQLQLELSQPYFFSNKNDLLFKPFFTWQDESSFDAKRAGLEATLNRQVTRRTNVFFSPRVEHNRVRGKTDSVTVETNKSVLSAGVRRNSTDQLFSPTRGHISIFVAEEAGRFLRSEFKYLKFYTEHRFFKQLHPGHVFAARIFAGAMKPIRGSIANPIEERFFSGGNYSVRGWGRQFLGPLQLNVATDGTRTVVPLGGDSAIEGSFEYRHPIYKEFTGAGFLDYGNVWQTWDGFDLLDLHYAIGYGLRYNTFIGPIRIDVAWKLNKQPLDDVVSNNRSNNRYQIHFSIGQAF